MYSAISCRIFVFIFYLLKFKWTEFKSSSPLKRFKTVFISDSVISLFTIFHSSSISFSSFSAIKLLPNSFDLPLISPSPFPISTYSFYSFSLFYGFIESLLTIFFYFYDLIIKSIFSMLLTPTKSNFYFTKFVSSFI